MTMYYVMEEGTERTLAMTQDKAVVEFLLKCYTVPCFVRISVK